MTIITILILAFVFALLFAPGYRKGSYVPLIILFSILFLAGLVSRYWIVPMGPIYNGVSWLPLLVVFILFGLLFSAQAPTTRKSAATDFVDKDAAAVGIFIWGVLVILIIAAIIGYVLTPS